MSIDLNSLSTLASLHYAKSNQMALARARQRLATGKQLGSGSESPAQIIASAQMQATLSALNAEAETNERALVVTSIADGALGQVSDLLNEAKGLVAANASAGGLSSDERAANQLQIDSILSSIDRLSGTTNFAGKTLLDGNAVVGASGQKLALASIKTTDLGQVSAGGADHSLSDLQTGGSLDFHSVNSTTSVAVMDAAIQAVATQRGDAGAFLKNAIEPRIAQIAGAREYLTSTLSMLDDTDIAMESAAATRAQLLAQASQSMLDYGQRKSVQPQSLLKATRLDVVA